jgi:hypothetical protein
MVALQWGTTIGYDILVFDKAHHVAYVEVKATASHSRKWLLEKKYTKPSEDAIDADQRFICCVDLTPRDSEPDVFVLPARVVADGFNYSYNKRFSRSPSFEFALNSKPGHHTRDENFLTAGEHIESNKYVGRFDVLGVKSVDR